MTKFVELPCLWILEKSEESEEQRTARIIGKEDDDEEYEFERGIVFVDMSKLESFNQSSNSYPMSLNLTRVRAPARSRQ